MSIKRTKVKKVALAGAADTGGGIGSWQNPEPTPILIIRLVVDRETQSAGACTMDAGTTATNATTSSDNLIDGVSLAATGLVDNLGDAGTNGKARQKLGVGEWVTFSRASGASASFVGSAYIEYIRVN